MASDFNSHLPLSAFWRYAEGSFVNVCFTQGRTLLDRLRRAVGLTASGAWDAALQTRLIGVVNTLRANDPDWQTVSDALQADLSLADGQPVSEETTRFGVWLAFYRTNWRRYDAIQFPDDALFPRWNVSPPATSAVTQLVCYDPSLDTDPAIIAPSELMSAALHSVTGVRLESGRAAPSSSTQTIVSQKPAIPTWAVILVSVLVVAGAVALTTNRKAESRVKAESGRRRK